MGSGGPAPGRDPPARAEMLLHESARTRVTRLFFPGRTVIRKEPLGPDAQRRLRHEVAMLQRLRGVDGRGAAGGGAALPGVDRAGRRRWHQRWPGWPRRWPSMS